MLDVWTPKEKGGTSYEQEFIESLNQHIAYVQEAGEDIGVSPYQLEIHDRSKWSDIEFYAYAKHFHGGGAPDDFAWAWLHHIHLNPHHWQHWIFPDGHTPKNSSVENGAVFMPDHYALEMIADWMGASKNYTGSWEMSDWLWEHIPKITVHSRTAAYLRQELDAHGYGDIVWKRKFANEAQI